MGLELSWRSSLPTTALPLLPPSCPDAADKGATALMAAAVHGRADIVSSLLSNGADPALTLPGTREAPGKTARQLAELYGHAAVLEVLDDHQEQVGVRVGW
jgi:ankyrin repeat protein